MVFAGLSPDGKLVEIAELKDHPFMVGTQFHPEFLSRPNRPHPLFVAFIQAICEQKGVGETEKPAKKAEQREKIGYTFCRLSTRSATSQIF